MNGIVSQIKATGGSSVILVAGILALFVTGPVSQVGPAFASSGTGRASVATYGKLPLSFEVNQGQADSQVKFLSRGRGYTLFLTSTEAALVLRQQAAGNRQQATGKIESVGETNSALSTQHSALQTVLRMKFVGASAGAQGAPEEQVGKVNYFIGTDRTKWRSNIPTYAKIHYRDVYPGVDLVYYGNQKQLEYDFIVAPGADPTTITLSFDGADKIEIDALGNLLLHIGAGEIRLRKPLIYQDIDGARQEISGGYVFVEANASALSTQHSALQTQIVGFQVAAHDVTRPLVIDPVLNYSTYLGGGGNDMGHGIAVDSAGNAYVTGSTDSTNFPTSFAFQLDQGGTDAFVAKLSPDGSQLLYSTYLGGGGNDMGHGIAVDSAGNAYVTGSTDSTNFPTSLAFQLDQGGTDAFVAKLSPDASQLLYSTYLGGGGNDMGHGIAVDSAGNAYVAGATDSTNFPTLNGVQGFQGGTDGFVAKMSPNGSQLLYSTYLGGSGNDSAYGIALGGAGKAYITGVTESNNFPLKNGFQSHQGLTDAFVTRLNPALSGLRSLLYSTYIGGSGNDAGLAIALSPEGEAYVTGSTDSANFPTLNAVQGFRGGTDLFVTKLDPSVSGSGSMLYSTYLGGSGNDEGYGISIDAAGNPYVTGTTESADFPIISGFATNLSGFQDAFVAKLVQADLVVGAFSVPPTGGAGSTILVSDTTKNQGEAAAEASKTKFYLSTDATLDAGDVLLGSRDISPLASGESSVGSTELAIPLGTAAGSYYIFVNVDADNAVAEALEGNNKSKRAIQIVHGPDLIVSAFSTAVSGSTITATETTKNQGVISANSSTTKFYLSADTELSASDILLGARAIPELAPGASSQGSVSAAIPTGIAAANYFIIAKADADNLVSEVNESNNSKSSNAITLMPDLVVASFSVPVTQGAGSVMTATETTKNQGVLSAGASTTKLYLSTDTTLDASDILLGSRAIPPLEAGGTNTGSTSLTIPAGTAPGTYFIIAKADGDNTVTESNENNNTVASIVIGPDLIITTAFAPPTAVAGSTIYVGNTTKNQGGASAGASATKLYLSTDTTLDASDILVGSRAIPALGPGMISVESTPVTIPSEKPAGTYYIIVQADADATVTETNEANNTRVSNALGIGADLILWALTVPSTATPGSAISVSDTTRNEGAASTGSSTTKFFLSTDANLDSGDFLLGSRTVPGLAPGTSSTGSTPLTMPVGIGGTYYIIAKADGDNVVPESNEANNIQAKPISLGPDLIVWLDLPASSMITGPGSTISINDTTRNDGFVQAGASTTKFYLSTDTTLDAGDILVGSRVVPALDPGARSTATTLLTIPAGIGGTYYILAKADGDNAVGEVNEANNVTATSNKILIGPDLIVWLDLPASSVITGAGSTISINNTTRNDSSIPAGASTTKFYLSTDTTLDSSDIFVGSQAVPALDPGARSTATTLLTIPAGVGGTYYILAKADGDNAVPESNEANNVTATANTIFVGPDLIVWLDLPASSRFAAAGSTISINNTTRNDGLVPAGASTTKFYLSTDTALDAGDILVGSQAVPALNPGDRSVATTLLTLPATTGGTYYILGKADGDNVVAESNEGNNITATADRILFGADLIVWYQIDYPGHPIANGRPITVSNVTKNESQVPVGASKTKFYLSADATLDAGDVLLGSRSIPALAPQELSSALTTLTIPADTIPGNYYFIAQADGDHVIAETNEINNIVANPIQVFLNQTGADLRVWFDFPGAAASGSLGGGATFTVNNITKNEGVQPAGSSTTKFYLSLDTAVNAGDILIGSQPVPALAAGAMYSATTPVTIPGGIGGTYYLIVQADADNAIAESAEMNNSAVSSDKVLVGPDLIVWLDNPGSASNAAPGSTLFINDTTRNDSPVPAGTSTTRFYLSTDVTLDAGDIPLGSRSVPALDTGARSTGSTPLTLPAESFGIYYIIAQADADNVVAESSESNNATVSNPIPIGPDLVITGVTAPAKAGANSTVYVKDFTKNQGTSSAAASTTRLYLSTDMILDPGDLLLGSRAIPALAPGYANSGSTGLPIPAWVATGNYFIIAMADADYVVGEASESNNTFAQPIEILPDLAVSNLIIPSTAVAGSTISITDTTINIGSSSTASATKFFLSTNATLDAGDTLLGNRAIPGLAPGAKSKGATSVTIPAATAAGTYYIIAMADGDNTVAEVKESNNAKAVAITITSSQ